MWLPTVVAILPSSFPFESNLLIFPSSHQCQLKEPNQPLPVPSEGSLEDSEELPAQRYERDLVQKLKILRHELSLQQPQAGHCRIEVSREEIFEVCRSVSKIVGGLAFPVHLGNGYGFLQMQLIINAAPVRPKDIMKAIRMNHKMNLMSNDVIFDIKNHCSVAIRKVCHSKHS